MTQSRALLRLGIEGFIEYPKAKQRALLGHCDPLVSNRFLLWGIVGIVWTDRKSVVRERV